MLRIIGCITQQHDLGLVVLAAVLCAFASATASCMIWRTRVSSGYHPVFWLASAGTVGCCGIWATHFIAMLGFNPGLPVSYDKALTGLSVLIAAVMCSGGIAIALCKGFELIGGALIGASISTMHYVGMAALKVPAVAVWDPTYVVASVLIGVTFSAAAMWLKLHRHSILPIAMASLLFTIAICGMHFTGMAALTFIPDPSIEIPETVFDPDAVALAVAASAMLILGLGLAGVLVDSHLAYRALNEAQHLRGYVQELEATRAQLQTRNHDLSAALAVADAGSSAKSRFIAVMSHELRTPLNAVLGFSDMILSEPFGAVHERYKDYLRDIRDSGTHLLSLVNTVLDLSKLDSGALKLKEEELAANAIVAEALKTMTGRAKTAQIRLLADIDPWLPPFRADRARIVQVLTNLIDNAIKFTPRGGSVRVGAKRREDGLVLFVSDTGIGIAEKDLPKAIDRFSQVDSTLSRRYEGTGLGLPLAKLLTEAHGGRIFIDSKENVGTTVTVLLPRSRLVEQLAA
jgi:signal transduction histidine kinase